MAYHHLALAVGDITATHKFYEGVMGFELVKVEIAPLGEGSWGKHFFYRINGDDSRFIAFWELHDTSKQSEHIYDLNKAGNLPDVTNHFAFSVTSEEELHAKREGWTDAGIDVLDINHGWCHSIYTRDPDNNVVEYCLTTGNFSEDDRAEALAALKMTEFAPTDGPVSMKAWSGTGRVKTVI